MHPTIMVMSDLHLTPSQPQKNHILCHIIQQQREHVAAIYLLGDILDCWLGGDDIPLWLTDVADICQDTTTHHCPIYLMQGNHDFLISATFCQHLGVMPLADPTAIQHGDHTWLMTHGDLLCTDDHNYQKLRKLLRSRVFQYCFVRAPMSLKTGFAKKLKNSSNKANAQRPKHCQPVMQTGLSMCQRHQAHAIIHGHIHVPTIDVWKDQNMSCPRLVTAAWRSDHGYFDLITTNGTIKRMHCSLDGHLEQESLSTMPLHNTQIS